VATVFPLAALKTKSVAPQASDHGIRQDRLHADVGHAGRDRPATASTRWGGAIALVFGGTQTVSRSFY
jgi:hypothetical protein